MALTKIEWADYTFNPWIGCTKVDDLCTNCYAESDDKRRKWTPEGWGKGKPRKRTSAANWQLVRRLNQRAQWFGHCVWCGYTGFNEDRIARCGLCSRADLYEHHPVRVFSASLADWLDDEVPIEWLADFLSLVRETPNLTWMLLTKRPENFINRLCLAATVFFQRGDHGACSWADAWAHRDLIPKHIWIGTSVGNQKSADLRVPQLLEIPARVRFLSCEPLLGPVDLKELRELPFKRLHFDFKNRTFRETNLPTPLGIHWVICGGESGPHARPMHPDWARSLRDQCAAAGVPFLFKQWGEFIPVEDTPHDFAFADGQLMRRVGKSQAGRLLDGVEHNAIPGFLGSKFNPPAPEALPS